MGHRLLYALIAFIVALVTWGLDPDGARQARAAELFGNYYVSPGSYGGVGAELYPSPRPTPPLVGHTYVTYQPFLPHEFLYQHHRQYWRRNPDGGWTRTVVTWQDSFFNLYRWHRPPKVVNHRPLRPKWQPW
jgi:hypothetical protein